MFLVVLLILCLTGSTCFQLAPRLAPTAQKRLPHSSSFLPPHLLNAAVDDQAEKDFAVTGLQEVGDDLSKSLSEVNGRQTIPYSPTTTAYLVLGQSVLGVFAATSAWLLGTPNWGLGNGFHIDGAVLMDGISASVPVLAFACLLEVTEAKLPVKNSIKKALAGVRASTQSSILLTMGPVFKPVAGLASALFLGLAAGIGEEWLFRGVCQPELIARVFGGNEAAGIAVTSMIFGALHFATPLYSILVAVVSLFFGQLALSQSLVSR